MAVRNDGAGEMGERIRSVLRVLAPLALLALIVALILYFANDKAGINREAVQTPMVALAPPPPPPPVPPKEKPPEPDKTVETPTPQPTPKPEAPQKTNDAPKQMTIAAPAQAGSDAYGAQAGNGGGDTIGGDPNGNGNLGDGFGEANYGRYLTGELQRRVEADDRLGRFTGTVLVLVWIAPDGSVTKVTIARTSGDARTDQEVLAALRGIGRLDQPPPPQQKFPARIAVRGRRA